MLNFILLAMPGLPEILVIALIVLLLFGGKKIPELMSGIGKGVREFRKAANGENEKETKKDQEEKAG